MLEVAGESNAAGEAGVSAGGGGNGPIALGFLIGPEVDNEEATMVSLDQQRATGEILANVSAFLTDGDGNLFTTTTDINKYEADLDLLWSFPLGGPFSDTVGGTIDVASMSTAPDGSLTFGGYAVAFADNKQRDALVGKLTPDGKLDWFAQWDSGGKDDSCVATATMPDGSVIAAGLASDQTIAGRNATDGVPWVARYDSSGALVWHEQYAELPPIPAFSPTQLFADSAGGIEYVADGSLLRVDAKNGKELSRQVVTQLTGTLFTGTLSFHSFLSLQLAEDGDGFYGWSLFRDERAGAPSRVGILQRSLAGELISFWESEDRQAADTPTAGVTWTGDMAGPVALNTTRGEGAFAVTPDAFYVTGKYVNGYRSGPLGTTVPMPAVLVPYAARYDRKGKRIWFHELAIEPTFNHTPWLQGFVLDRDGNPTILVEMRGLNEATGSIFKLDKGDGTLL